MVLRTLGSLAIGFLVFTSGAWAQSKTTKKEPVADGRTLSQWVADLKAIAPQVRNAAAYEISGLGPAAAPAVPALIKALDDPEPSVRFPVTVALREIGPAAEAAVPRLKKMVDEEINDEVAAGARRALKAIKPDALSQESGEGDKD
jgi:HEAT repeat protein